MFHYFRRSDVPDVTVFGSYGDRSHIKVNSGVNQHLYGNRSHIKVVNQQIRPPFLVLAHNEEKEEEKNQTNSAKESEGEQLTLRKFLLLDAYPGAIVKMQHSEFLFC